MARIGIDEVRIYFFLGSLITIATCMCVDEPQRVRDHALVAGESRDVEETVGVTLSSADRTSYAYFARPMIDSALAGAALDVRGSAVLSDVGFSADSGRVRWHRYTRGYDEATGMNVRVRARVTMRADAIRSLDTLLISLPGLIPLAQSRGKIARIVPRKDFGPANGTSAAIRSFPVYATRAALERKVRVWQAIVLACMLLYVPLLVHIIKTVTRSA
ncbi:MAG: hypothetical protein M3081_19475 [Gemmatimonadota bacterium]|nr:hypothetical protein [Gemmatimonadota bacterium]